MKGKVFATVHDNWWMNFHSCALFELYLLVFRTLLSMFRIYVPVSADTSSRLNWSRIQSIKKLYSRKYRSFSRKGWNNCQILQWSKVFSMSQDRAKRYDFVICRQILWTSFSFSLFFLEVLVVSSTNRTLLVKHDANTIVSLIIFITSSRQNIILKATYFLFEILWSIWFARRKMKLPERARAAWLCIFPLWLVDKLVLA